MKKKFDVTGMTCAACSSRVEKTVDKLPGVDKVQVNLLTNSMVVDYEEKEITSEDIEKAVSKAGYLAKVKEKNLSETSKSRELARKNLSLSDKGSKSLRKVREEEAASMKKRLVWSLAFLIPMMYFSMGHMVSHDLPTLIPLANALAQFMFLIPILYLNRKYFQGGLPSLFRGSPNMDSLISMGSGIGTIYGVYTMFSMIYGAVNHDIYFESAGMILTLITLGKFLETKSKGKTTAAIEKLMDLAPKTVTIEEDGVEKEIMAEDITLGDILIIRPGQLIGADGEIVFGKTSVDQSAITGESIPVDKTLGDKVISATINQSGFIKVRAEKVGENSTINQIIALVEEAAASKAPIAQMADKIAGIFVPVVISIALVTFIAWMAFDGSLEFAINCSISVLVISCPCALGLATPVAIMVGTGKGAEQGILIKSGEALETLHSIDTVVMDKTGTITQGKPLVRDVIVLNEEVESQREKLFEIAYALEESSEHPLGKAVVKFVGYRNLKATEFKATFGLGVEGVIKGERYFAGNLAFVKERGVSIEDSIIEDIGKNVESLGEEGKTPLIFFNKDKALGILALADVEKPTSRKAISVLNSMGIDLVMLTGDNEKTGKSIAENLGIKKVIAQVLPQDKEKNIRLLQDQGKKVAMIGDGINDGPALVRADVGIAIGAGTDVAIDSADVVLIHSDLTDGVGAIELSKAVIRNIKENLFWAFFYNAILIPVAAGVFYPAFGFKLNPMLGAAAMSMSSVCVVMNALRLKLFKSKTLEDNKEKNKEEKTMKYELKIEGMMCTHCQKHMEDALNKMKGVEAKVDLEEGKAYVESKREKQIPMEEFEKVVAEAGYTLIK